MTKEIKQKATEYAENKTNKGNYDYAVGDNVYYSESALKKAYIAGATETTKKMQEEIKKLKSIKDVSDLLRLNNDAFTTMCQLNNRFVSVKHKLEKAEGTIKKAKEIIREYLEWTDWKDSNCPSFANICKKAEAFIKDIKEQNK